MTLAQARKKLDETMNQVHHAVVSFSDWLDSRDYNCHSVKCQNYIKSWTKYMKLLQRRIKKYKALIK